MKSLSVIILFTSALVASPVTISLGGTFSPATSNNTYFAPNGVFSLSFQVNDPPAVVASGSNFFKTTYSNASYTLNGNPVVLSGSEATFFTTESLDFCFSSNGCQYQMTSQGGSPELFSGPTASPAFVTGSYQVNQWFTAVNNVNDGGSPSGGTITVASTGAAVPEPATWILTLAGLLMAGVCRKRGRRMTFASPVQRPGTKSPTITCKFQMAMAIRFLSVIVLLTSGLAASPVTISLSGTYGLTAQNTPYFAPNETFGLSFQIDNPPAVVASASFFFQTTYSNASYTLNGNPVALSGSMVSFFNSGGLVFCFSGNGCQYELTAEGSPLLFSGPPVSPTLVTGSYQATSWVTAVSGGIDGGSPSGGTITIAPTGAAVPEPATWMLTFAGILVACVYRRIRMAPVRAKMLPKLYIGAVALTLTQLSSGGLQAIPLYSFGPDNMNQPRSFTAIDTQNSTAQPLYNMNDLNDGFNGGVTFRASDNLFYAVINDSFGNSSLVSFALAGGGAFNTVQAIGTGFFGGLTFDKANGNFYGVGLDALGNSTLYRIALGGPTTSVRSLGLGFNGGLTFDQTDQNLYAISNDSQGNSTLNRISLAGGGSVTALSGGLGSGFLGGVAYDGASNSFYAIVNDVLGNSSLDQIIVSGSSVVSETSLFSVGSGFVNAGLTGADSVPEPSTLWLFAGGVSILLLRRRISSFLSSGVQNDLFLQEYKMIYRPTLLPRLAVLAGLAFCLPMWGQYSSPIRDVSDPGRAPFQIFTATELVSGDNTPLVITSLPAGASQRLVVDFANIRVQGSSTLPGFVTINVSASSSLPAFQISFTVTPIPEPAPSQQISIGSQSIRLYVSAGQTLTVQTLNLGSDVLFIDASITGHYVTLP
jgi:hypothetical protein